MANTWFRFYAEFATDPKVQMLTEVEQRRFVMLLCLRCNVNSNDDVTLHETLSDENIAFQLRISLEEWQKTRAIFISKKLINKYNVPSNWDKRQYISDRSAVRVKRFREKKKQVCNVTVTSPDTDTDTDTDSNTPISPLKIPTKTRSSKFDPLAAKPENLSSEVWAEWIKYRRERKGKTTESTCRAQAKKLSGLSPLDAEAVIRRSIENGWTGLFTEQVIGYASNYRSNKPLAERVKDDLAEFEKAGRQSSESVDIKPIFTDEDIPY